MILPIYLYGSEVLRRENVDVDLNDKEGIATLLENMWETLGVADGCGLAAPQVGVNKNIVIVDGRELSDTYDYLHDFVRVMINPVVLEEITEKQKSTCQTGQCDRFSCWQILLYPIHHHYYWPTSCPSFTKKDTVLLPQIFLRL